MTGGGSPWEKGCCILLILFWKKSVGVSTLSCMGETGPTAVPGHVHTNTLSLLELSQSLLHWTRKTPGCGYLEVSYPPQPWSLITAKAGDAPSSPAAKGSLSRHPTAAGGSHLWLLQCRISDVSLILLDLNRVHSLFRIEDLCLINQEAI